MSGRRNSVPVAGVEVDDEMIFEMEEDEVVRENASGEAAHSARCSVCRANFAVCSEHKVLRRRRRGRRSRVLCDDCRSTCDGSHDGSDDGSSKDGGEEAEEASSSSTFRPDLAPERANGGGARSRSGTDLDADTLNAILVRLVSTGTAELLGRCSCVSRIWYAGALNDELWGTLFVRRWGPLALWRQEDRVGGNEPPMSYRALYIRSATTQVLVWGQGGLLPRPLEGTIELCGVKSVSAGGDGLSCAVTWDGRVLCWGSNSNGQCGVSASAETSFLRSPVSVELAGDYFVLQVSCGTAHVACVCHCGALFCWGSNADGQLGVASMPEDKGSLLITPVVEPVLAAAVPMMYHTLTSAGAYTQVACGATHTVALGSHGAVFAWGSNISGQCGRMADQDLPDADSTFNSNSAGSPSSYLVEAMIDINVARVAAGSGFTLAVAPGVGVFSFGTNAFGQLGRDTEIPHDSVPGMVDFDNPVARAMPVQDLCCGDFHSILSLADRSVWVWGRGTQAALGLGAETKYAYRPVLLPSSGELRSALLAKSCAGLCLAAGGANSALLSSVPALPRPVPIPQLRGQVGIEMTGPLKDAASQLFTWGANKVGELGHGDTAKRAVPRLVKMLKGGMRGVGGGAASTSAFAVSLGGNHAVALVEWRVGAAGRGWWGEGAREGTPTPTDSLSSSCRSSTPGTPSTPGSFSSPAWPARTPPLAFSLSRSCPEEGTAAFKLSVSPSPAAAKAPVPFNGGYPAKGGNKQRYSAGGGRNCREIQTKKTSKKKDAKEGERNGGRKESKKMRGRRDREPEAGADEAEHSEADPHVAAPRNHLAAPRKDQQDVRPLDVRNRPNGLRAQLHAFKASDATQLDLDPELSAAERSRAHQMCAALGLLHVSTGQGASRRVRITKPHPVHGHEREAAGGRRRGVCRGAAMQGAAMHQLGQPGSSSDDVDEWAAEAARYSSQGGFHELEWHACDGASSGPLGSRIRQGRGEGRGGGVEHGPWTGAAAAGWWRGADGGGETADEEKVSEEGVRRRREDGDPGWPASHSL